VLQNICPPRRRNSEIVTLLHKTARPYFFKKAPLHCSAAPGRSIPFPSLSFPRCLPPRWALHRPPMPVCHHPSLSPSPTASSYAASSCPSSISSTSSPPKSTSPSCPHFFLPRVRPVVATASRPASGAPMPASIRTATGPPGAYLPPRRPAGAWSPAGRSSRL
jgi:hypothetical protein